MKIKAFSKVLTALLLIVFVPAQVLAFDQVEQIAALTQAPTVDADAVQTPPVTPLPSSPVSSGHPDSISFIQREEISLQKVEENQLIDQRETSEARAVDSDAVLSAMKSTAVLAALEDVKAEENQAAQMETDIARSLFATPLETREFPAETQRRLLLGDDTQSSLPTLEQAQKALAAIPAAIRPYTSIRYQFRSRVSRTALESTLLGEANNLMVEKPSLQQAAEALESMPEAVRPYVTIRFRDIGRRQIITGTLTYGPDGIITSVSSVTPVPRPTLSQQLAKLWNKISWAMDGGADVLQIMQLFYEGLQEIYQERYNQALEDLQSGRTDIESQFIEIMSPISDIPYITNIGDAGHNCAFFSACTTAVGQKNDFYVYNVSIWFYAYENLAPDISGPPRSEYIAHAINLVWLGRSEDGLFDYYGFWEPQHGRMVHRFVVDASDKDPRTLPASAILGYMQNSGFGFADAAYQIDPNHGLSIRTDPAILHPGNRAAIRPSLLKFLYQAYLPPDLAEQAIESIPDISRAPAVR